MRKKYISTAANPLSIDIIDNGMLRTFTFKGGMKHPAVVMPAYITGDEEEQKLLESYPGFGSSFILEGQVIVVSKEEEVIPLDEEPLQEKTFKNVQAAKDWINSEFNIPFHLLTNRTKIVDKALELGYTLIFESDNK